MPAHCQVHLLRVRGARRRCGLVHPGRHQDGRRRGGPKLAGRSRIRAQRFGHFSFALFENNTNIFCSFPDRCCLQMSIIVQHTRMAHSHTPYKNLPEKSNQFLPVFLQINELLPPPFRPNPVQQPPVPVLPAPGIGGRPVAQAHHPRPPRLALHRLLRRSVLHAVSCSEDWVWFGLVWFIEGSLSVITIHTLELLDWKGFAVS